MEPFKKRDRFLSCNVLNQLGNHPADDINTATEEVAPADLSGSHLVDATFDENLIVIEEDAPADLLGSHPVINTDDRENAPNDKDALADLAIRRSAGDAFNDANQVNQTNEPIADGDANHGTFVAVIGDVNEADVEKPDETMVIEHGGGDGASDAVGCEEKPDETMVIENAGGDGSASDALEIVDGKKLEAVDVACNVGSTQTEGNQQAHTKRKCQEPGEFSPDAGDSDPHAPRPKRTKNGDAGTDGTGTGSSTNIPIVAGNRRFLRLFGTNIPRDQEEHELPATNQPMRTLRLFGVDIIPQDPAAADTRNGSSPTDQESGGHGL